MMKKRVFAMVMAIAMVLSLAGCSATLCSVSINSDGSGVLGMKYGLTQEGLQLLADNAGGMAWTDVLEAQSAVPFTEDGVTYYGVSEQHSFADLNELTQLVGALGESSDVGLALNSDGMTLIQNKTDGSFELTLEGLNDSQSLADAMTASGMDASELEQLKSQMVMKFSFTFPSPIVQTMGAKAGVMISGNTVTVDTMKLQGKCVFSTASNAVLQTPGPFTDVALNAWYCPAITALSNGGIIDGVGDGSFQPMGTITYSQFAQIIAKATGLPTGTKDGYWAAGAIESCVSSGYFASKGAVTSAVYDVVMTREEAVAALMKAIPSNLLTETNVSPVIPDLNAVTVELQSAVVDAYRYGVAKGTGDGTFNPKGTLSRAEFCQLLYNIGWFSVAK